MKKQTKVIIASLVIFNYLGAIGSLFFKNEPSMITPRMVLFALFVATLNVAFVHCFYTLIKKRHKTLQVLILWCGVLFALFSTMNLFD